MRDAFIYSIFIWTGLYFLAFLVITSMGIEISFLKVILGDTFLELSAILPIYTIGGFGVIEGAWALAFISLGVPKQAAIASGLGYHILLLFYVSIISIPAFISHLRKVYR